MMNQNNALAAAAALGGGSPLTANRLIRWRELREFLGVSDSQMHALSNKGELPPFVRLGRSKFFAPTDVNTWLQARKSAA
jgi:predicted DNA-binding transcriptional regulator AlpA